MSNRNSFGPIEERPERFFVLECGKIEQGLARLK